MRRPVRGEPLTMKDYFAGSAKVHLWGLVAGLLRQSGTIFNYVVSYAKIVGPAASYAVGVWVFSQQCHLPPDARSVLLTVSWKPMVLWSVLISLLCCFQMLLS
jgi:hypothetical protein